MKHFLFLATGIAFTSALLISCNNAKELFNDSAEDYEKNKQSSTIPSTQTSLSQAALKSHGHQKSHMAPAPTTEGPTGDNLIVSAPVTKSSSPSLLPPTVGE